MPLFWIATDSYLLNVVCFHFTALEDADNGDSLDDYMNTMSQRMDKQTKIKLKRKIFELRKVSMFLVESTACYGKWITIIYLYALTIFYNIVKLGAFE